MSKISIKKDFADGEKLFAVQLNNNFKVIEEGINANEENLQGVIDQAIIKLDNELEEITAARGWDWNGGDRVKFYKGTSSQIASKEVENGTLLYDIATKATYLDNNDERIPLSTGTIVDTEMSDTSLHAIANKTVKKYVDDKIEDTYSTANNKSYSANYVNSIVDNFDATTGDIDNLNTTAKSNLVNAVNEVNNKTELNYIVAYKANNQTLNQANTKIRYYIDTILSSNGNKLIFHGADGTDKANSIEIGKGVNHVEVSGQIYISTHDQNTNKALWIFKNGNEVSYVTSYIDHDYNMLKIGSIIIPVTEGDIITLYVRSYAGTGTVLAGNIPNNFLMAKVLD